MSIKTKLETKSNSDLKYMVTNPNKFQDSFVNIAKEILDECEIETRTINKLFSVTLEYPELNQIMRFIKEHNLNIVEQKMEMNCEIILSIRLKDADYIFDKLTQMHKMKTEII